MLDLMLILADIRSTYNVGSILRSAGCFDVKEIVFTGYTPYPKLINDLRLPHQIQKQTRAIHKTALGAERLLSMIHFDTTQKAIQYARDNKYLIAALEQSKSSQNLGNYSGSKPVALILGNEVDGLESKTLKSCDMILEIELFGKKESLNVAMATAIALYALQNQTPKI